MPFGVKPPNEAKEIATDHKMIANDRKMIASVCQVPVKIQYISYFT